MKINKVKGNVLKSDAEVICHQTNCLGVMGGGVALQVKNIWPEVYEKYKSLCDMYADNPEELLGKVQYCSIGGGQTIANIFGQCEYGTDKRYTDYNALQDAFDKVASDCQSHKIQKVAIPYMFGCGLAGGDWSIVEGIITTAFENTDVIVELVEFAK